MPAKKKNSTGRDSETPAKKKDSTGQTSESKFIDSTFAFFSGVLKSIVADDLLRVLWGVEVLLFSILALMIFFGSITGDQRFFFALIIVASVVAMFLITIWRMSHRQPGQISQPALASKAADRKLSEHADPEPTVSDKTLIKHAEKCLVLLTEIDAANARILRRGRSGVGPWARLLSDTYNHVCEVCHQRRLVTEPADSYFDAICAEPDLETLCVKKWELGEAMEDYRRRLDRIAPMPEDHDALEMLIRRSVTQPDRSPSELESALRRAIDDAKNVISPHGR